MILQLRMTGLQSVLYLLAENLKIRKLLMLWLRHMKTLQSMRNYEQSNIIALKYTVFILPSLHIESDSCLEVLYINEL